MNNLEKLKNKIKNNVPIVGTHVSMSYPMIGEMLGLIGFDFVWIDMEHNPFSLEDVLGQIIAIEGAGAAPLVRIPSIDPIIVKRVLELVPAGIIFPNVRSREEAELAVKSCLYPPKGIRGFGPGRASRYGLTDTARYIQDSETATWKIIQIEHIEALDHLDEILAVEGVDTIVIGPNDLSGSIGLLGQTDHPNVKKLMDRIAEKARLAGIPFGVSMGYNPLVIREWIERGVSWIGAGSDIGYMFQQAMEAFKGTSELFDN